jgi:RHS repeat-associated protein
VNHIQYDTFGQLTSQTDTTKTPWFGYTGREWDTATGLTYYRARWYDPRAGRFISEDPLSFAAGDVNLNRYVGNGATLWVDPSGMAMTDQYLPGISNQAYSDYLQSQSAIANFLADPKEVAAFLNRNGLYEDAFIDDYINQLDPSNRLDHLRQGLKEGLAELERQVQEHLVEQAMSAAVGPALGAASFVARKGVAKIAIQRLRKKSARAAGMRVTGRLTGTAGSNAAEEMARREAAVVAPRKVTTPSAAARAKSQGEYIDPLTNTVVKTTETLAADHIFPKALIKELP